MYDIIGDIHGHASELLLMLKKLGYRDQNGAYRHPKRKALFLGDYIDRGPDSLLCLQIVRNMVEAGSAVALMGNHEYNAICFHQEDENGGHLRAHKIKNINQHQATLNSFHGKQELYDDYINWFRSLPMYFENEQLRAVHACWEPNEVEIIKEHLSDGVLTEELAIVSSNEKTELYEAVEQVLKGVEIDLPDNEFFYDKDGNKRTKARVKWWENSKLNTYKKLGMALSSDFPADKEIPENVHQQIPFYGSDEKPVFFGHYWLKGKPELRSDNSCCLDFSVAKGGVLAAYRFDGERKLSPEKLVWVSSNK